MSFRGLVFLNEAEETDSHVLHMSMCSRVRRWSQILRSFRLPLWGFGKQSELPQDDGKGVVNRRREEKQ